MDKVQQSLQDNKEEILTNLPAEFHADFEKECESACEDTGSSSVDEIKSQILDALPGDLRKELHDSIEVPKASPPLSFEEQTAEVLSNLHDESLKEAFKKRASEELLG